MFESILDSIPHHMVFESQLIDPSFELPFIVFRTSMAKEEPKDCFK